MIWNSTSHKSELDIEESVQKFQSFRVVHLTDAAEDYLVTKEKQRMTERWNKCHTYSRVRMYCIMSTLWQVLLQTKPKDCCRPSIKGKD